LLNGPTEQTNAGRVQDLLSHPFVSPQARDSTSITPKELKLSSISILSHADHVHHDAEPPSEGFSDAIDFPSPAHNDGFSRNTSRLSSPLSTSFLPSSNGSQHTHPSSDAGYSGHYHQHSASPSFLNQCLHACEGHRQSSTQFLLAHGRSRPVLGPDGCDTGVPSERTQYSGSGSYTWSKCFV
jgi:hypothetical protein